MTTTWEQQARRLDPEGKLGWMVKCGELFGTRRYHPAKCRVCGSDTGERGLVPAPFSEGLVMDGLLRLGYDRFAFEHYSIDDGYPYQTLFNSYKRKVPSLLKGTGPTRKDAMCAALEQLPGPRL